MHPVMTGGRSGDARTCRPRATGALALPRHGGDRSAIAAATGVRIALDLSTGINPWPYPVPRIESDHWSSLPDREGEARLQAAAATAYDASAGAEIVAAPGSQAIIQWLPRLRMPGQVTVISPTYSEHAASWRAAGHAVEETSALPEAGATDVIVVANPNNPDGRRHAPGELLTLAAAQAERDGWLVVDEAFADVDPAVSCAPQTGRDGLVVLRSFGKFFGLAGARLGFALCPPAVAAALRGALGPWAVSGPAAVVGAVALADEAWIATTRGRLAAAARRLDGLLERAGLEVIGGTTLFRLARCRHARAVFRALAEQGVLVRCFGYRDDWLRFGLPADERGSARLEAALRRAL